jgi:hypothetical protein
MGCLQGMLETAILKDNAEAGMHAVTVWLRYSAMRHLTWNRNYNVKPREVSAAQVKPRLSTPPDLVP